LAELVTFEDDFEAFWQENDVKFMKFLLERDKKKENKGK
jgi:hypothetical protein